MKRIIVVVIAYLITAKCFAQSTQVDEKEIVRLEKEWHNAYKTKDTAILIRILATEFINLNSVGNQYSKNAIINGLKTDNARYDTIYPYDMQFSFNNDVATVIGKTREVGLQNGVEFDNSYFWTDVFVKKRNVWQCTLAQTAPLPKPRIVFGEGLSVQDSNLVYQVNEHIKSLLKSDEFSGSVLIAKKDAVLYKASFGSASKEYNVYNVFSTAFNLASMTKMFTGVAISQLVAQGKLSFNDYISKYLPSLPSKLTKTITIYHLLTHTSGVGSYWTDEFHNSNHAAYRKLSDYIPFIKNDFPAFKPGTKWAYSNTGYLLLGLIIEKISGMSYFDYVKKNVFEKAGMTNAGFYEADMPGKNIATAYTKDNRYINDSTKYSIPVFIAPVKGSPAGGAYASVMDLYKFSQALYSHKLLSQSSTDTLIKGKVSYGAPEQQKKYAYGFANQIVNNKMIVFHDGAANGVSTIMDMYPDSSYTVIVLSNYDHPASWKVMGKVRELIYR